ncbi:MAG: hypothetical protein WAK71_24830 [Streptosporangiaceae bacterium]
MSEAARQITVGDARVRHERILFRWAGQQDDAREGVEAFLDRRPASWKLSRHTPLPPEAALG